MVPGGGRDDGVEALCRLVSLERDAVVSGCLGGVGGRHRSRRSPGSSAREPTRPLLRSPCPARGPASVAAGVNKGPGGVQPAVARGGGHRSYRRRDLVRVAACGDAGSSRGWTGGVGGPVALGDLRSAERRAVCRGRAREALPDQSSRGLQHLKEAVLCPATWRARGAVPDQTGGGRGSCAPTWTGCGTTRLSRSWRPWNTSSVRRTEPADLRTRGPNRHRGRVPGAGPQGVHRAVRHLAAKGVQHRRGRHGSAQRAG